MVPSRCGNHARGRNGRTQNAVERATRLECAGVLQEFELERERLAQGLRNAFQLEPVLETRIDPDLIGGLVVRIGDWLYDGSVRNKLEIIRDQIIERSSHEIQSGRDRFCTDEGNH